LKQLCRHKCFFLLVFVLASVVSLAQKPRILQSVESKVGGINAGTGGVGGPGGNDSLKARNKYEDSVTVTVYYLDSSRGYRLDTVINDFTRRYPIPATHIYLGNTGVATRSILFAPRLVSGFDPGFHALDAYKWQLEKVRFFNSTRPYTELGYMLASKAEQIIEILHTQNIKPYWNFSLNYRLINAPGTFRNQKTNHNNYLFTSWYQSQNKRYNNYFIALSNQLQSGESGGIKTNKYLDDPIYAKDRYTIPTNIGGQPSYSRDFFSTVLNTGNRYKETTILLRQQYDLGKKDSLVTDSTVLPLFYPRLRFEHTFKYGKYSYVYQDNPTGTNSPDSAYYFDKYNLQLPASDSVFLRDKWKEISNDFSVYQFPDAKNLQQFIKLGIELQLLEGSFLNVRDTSSRTLVNTMAHGEYRNRTKNQKWDMLAVGKLFLSGYNLGDYHAYVSLQRMLSQKLGSLQVGFENFNRTPPYIFNTGSAFYLDAPKSFSKENTTHVFASAISPKYKLQLSADYYLIGNYLYFNGYNKFEQEKTLFNVLRVNALKTVKLGKRWNWYAEVYLQRETGSVQLNMPLLYTRNRVMYEGNLGFRNLVIAMGAELRYHSPYKADNYSPVLGQFFYQDTLTINNLPDVAAFLHFKIRSFKAFVRAENLNTGRTLDGFHFSNNNLAAPGYPTPGAIFRFGVYWGFVN
jgi:hypothetical protein